MDFQIDDDKLNYFLLDILSNTLEDTNKNSKKTISYKSENEYIGKTFIKKHIQPNFMKDNQFKKFLDEAISQNIYTLPPRILYLLLLYK